MRSTDLGSEYEKLGQLMIEAVRAKPDGIFLYAEIEPGVINPALFEDVTDRLIYRHPTIEMNDQIDKIWDQLDEDDRWHSIRCMVRGGRFEATLGFADDLDPLEDENDRRVRVLKEVFGNKLVDYSEPDPDDVWS